MKSNCFCSRFEDCISFSEMLHCLCSPEQCDGCRRCPNADRKHCFEVLLADGSTLELAAQSEALLQNWLICLCQATSDQTGTGVRGCFLFYHIHSFILNIF